MTTTTQLYGFGHYASNATVEDSVTEYVGEFVNDYDVDGLTNAYRDAINTALDGTTIVLRGDDFYADYPAPSDSEDLIKAALVDVDLGALAGEYDKG